MDNKKKYPGKWNYTNVTKKVETKVKTAGDILIEKPKEKAVTDWFYMIPNEVTAKMISDLIKLQSNVQVDLWEEMNILQLELANKLTVDFEPMKIDFKDPSDAAFVKNRNIKTIFAMTIEEEAFKEMKVIFKLLFSEWDGFICADSDDFKPIYGQDDL